MHLRVLILAGCLAAASSAWSQTPEVPAAVPHATHIKKPQLKKTRAGHAVPVVSPRHGPIPRHAGRKGAKLVTPPPPKPAPKPVPKAVAPAKPAIPADQGTVTGLHLPRYASLKSDEVNMRSGPGSRYPVLWTYKRRELPVRIEREFDVWRLVEDMDGIKGWVHQATLTGRRSFVITGAEPRNLRNEASDTSAAVAVLKPGVVGRLRACVPDAPWCEVQVGEYRGWLARADFWGADAGETVLP